MKKIGTDDNLNQGRWSSDEIKAFLKGLETFGRNWKLIAKLIGTRDKTQVRSHAQKFFLRTAPKSENNNMTEEPEKLDTSSEKTEEDRIFHFITNIKVDKEVQCNGVLEKISKSDSAIQCESLPLIYNIFSFCQLTTNY